MSLEIYKPENSGFNEFNFSQLLKKSQEMIGKKARVELSDGGQFGIYAIYSIEKDGVFFKLNHESGDAKFFITKNQIKKVVVES